MKAALCPVVCILDLLVVLLLTGCPMRLQALPSPSPAGPSESAGPVDPSEPEGKGKRKRHPRPAEPQPAPPPAGPHPPNELGVIPILEFHHFGEANERWTLSWNDFRRLLEDLYRQGFRPVNLIEVVERSVPLPRGFIPVVLTFDDGNPEQFRWDPDSPGRPDPASAVGVLWEFHRRHPDWALRGTFFVNRPAFGSTGGEEKLRWLAKQGFEIGNHTLTHVSLRGMSAEEALEEVGGLAAWVEQSVPGYRVRTLAYPNGTYGPDLPETVWSGTYQGHTYQIEAAVLVGAGPAPSPYHRDWRAKAIPRIQVASPEAVPEEERNYVWDAWRQRLLDRQGFYVADGNPDCLTVPNQQRQEVAGEVPCLAEK